jgi:hypothetical protein
VKRCENGISDEKPALKEIKGRKRAVESAGAFAPLHTSGGKANATVRQKHSVVPARSDQNVSKPRLTKRYKP